MRYNANDAIGINIFSKTMFFFMVIGMILLPFVAEKKKEESQENIDPPNQGVLRVEIFWPDSQNIDVDLWTAGPVGNPVGYSNKGSELWNLLRDDLGTGNNSGSDLSGVNMETSYTRGIWDGEYIVNIHLYALDHMVKGIWKDAQGEWHSDDPSKLPVPVRVILYYKEARDKPEKQLVFTDVKLKAAAQELTVFRFIVKDFQVDLSTLNNLQKKIRPADASGPTGGMPYYPPGD